MKTLHPLCLAAGGLSAAAVVAAVLLPSPGPVSFGPAPSPSLTDPPGSFVVQSAQLVPVEGRATLAEALDKAGADVAEPSADYTIAPHRAHPASDALYEATNAAQGLRVAFAAGGIRVVAEGVDAELSMDLRAIGHVERMQSVTNTALYARGERIDYHRTTSGGAAITEYYVNRADGVEQSFLLEAPVDARRSEPLVIELACSGDYTPRMEPTGDAIRFATADGTHTLHYDGLYAFDATGRELRSWMELRDQGLALVVDDARATYPVTVDPKVKGGKGGGSPYASDVVFRDGAMDGIVSDGRGDYVDGVDKVTAEVGGSFRLEMGTKGNVVPREAQFDFSLVRLLLRDGGQYEGAHGDLPELADTNRMLSNSVLINTWGGIAYERDSEGVWHRTDDVSLESMASGEVAYMGINVALVYGGPHVIWKLFFGRGWVGGGLPPLDGEPVKVTRMDETTWTIETLTDDDAGSARAALATRVDDGEYQFGIVDYYDLPFKITITKQ